MPALFITRIAPQTETWPEITGPDPDWEGGGDPPTVVLQHAGSETIIKPVVTIPGRWSGVQLRPAAGAMLILALDVEQADIPDHPDILRVPVARLTDTATQQDALALQDFFGFSNGVRNQIPGRRVGEVLMFIMDVKPTPKNGRRLLQIAGQVIHEEAA